MVPSPNWALIYTTYNGLIHSLCSSVPSFTTSFQSMTMQKKTVLNKSLRRHSECLSVKHVTMLCLLFTLWDKPLTWCDFTNGQHWLQQEIIWKWKCIQTFFLQWCKQLVRQELTTGFPLLFCHGIMFPSQCLPESWKWCKNYIIIRLSGLDESVSWRHFERSLMLSEQHVPVCLPQYQSLWLFVL